MDVMSDTAAALADHTDKARTWLLEEALPLWDRRGIDRERGGFFERLTLTGDPDENERRARVAARQVYCFAAGAQLGWPGPAEAAVRHGIDWLLGPARRADGLIVHRIAPDGTVLDSGPDLYDQAFFLLALAKAHRRCPDRHLDREAERVLATLRRNFSHTGGGFEDAHPPRLPLRANPHMHLFEAALAWIDAAPDIPEWRMLAAEMHDLMERRFIDPATGALREFFEADWSPVGSDRQVLEPGHHFEWAWLLLRWRAASGAPTQETASRLFNIGERYGIDPVRGVAVDGLSSSDFAVVSEEARLWPQTERLKAGLALARVSTGAERERARGAALSACEAIVRYLKVPQPGLWRDRMRKDGTFVEEPAPGSSFYHLVCAYGELFEAR